MNEIIKAYMKEHGFDSYKFSEPTLMVYLSNNRAIKIVFDMILIEHSLLSKADCVRIVLNNKLMALI